MENEGYETIDLLEVLNAVRQHLLAVILKRARHVLHGLALVEVHLEHLADLEFLDGGLRAHKRHGADGVGDIDLVVKCNLFLGHGGLLP